MIRDFGALMGAVLRRCRRCPSQGSGADWRSCLERFVEPGDTLSPGEPMMSLYSPVSLRVEAWVREAPAMSLVAGEARAVEIPAPDRQSGSPSGNFPAPSSC